MAVVAGSGHVALVSGDGVRQVRISEMVAGQQLNLAFYTAFYIDDDGLKSATLRPPFDDLHNANLNHYLAKHAKARAERRRENTPASDFVVAQTSRTRSLQLAETFSATGWSKRVMVACSRKAPRPANSGYVPPPGEDSTA
jgi:hypothetical protein